MMDKHWVWVFERVSVFLMLVPFVYFTITVWQLLVLGLALVASYMFFHDTAYYTTRGRIDVPQYNWKSHSTTSSAKINLDFRARLWSIALSLALMILILLFL